LKNDQLKNKKGDFLPLIIARKGAISGLDGGVSAVNTIMILMIKRKN